MVREEAEARLGGLSELDLASDGGHPGAERRCLLLGRAGSEPAGPGPDGAGDQRQLPLRSRHRCRHG